MVTGQRAFAGESRMSMLLAILKEEPKPPEAVPAGLEKIIRRCLRKDPARRFQHMDDLKVALEEVREDSESGRLTAAGPAPRKGVPNWVWAAGLGLGLAALGAWWASRPVVKPVEAFRVKMVDGGEPLQVTRGAADDRSPRWSPDGRFIAFARGGAERKVTDRPNRTGRLDAGRKIYRLQ